MISAYCCKSSVGQSCLSGYGQVPRLALTLCWFNSSSTNLKKDLISLTERESLRKPVECLLPFGKIMRVIGHVPHMGHGLGF